jgi:hypothetical protein
MRKGPTIALMIGMPHAEEGQNEDINREQDNDGDDDIAQQAIIGIVDCLHKGPSGIRDVRLLAEALSAMADAVTSHDNKQLEDAACDAHEVLSGMIED